MSQQLTELSHSQIEIEMDPETKRTPKDNDSGFIVVMEDDENVKISEPSAYD